MKRLLFIDCQLLQTAALHRGMGKYTLAVLDEYKKINLPYEEIIIVLSDQYSSEADELYIKKALTPFKLCRLPLKKTNPANPEEYKSISEFNRTVVNKYISQNYPMHSIDFLIAALFYEDGCSVFPSRAVNKYLLVYDLIPLQFPQYYLEDSRGQYQYLSRYKEFFKATHYFAISNTVSNDLSLQLGIQHTNITAINGSYIKRKALKPKKYDQIKNGEKYILMPTGDDIRKNNLRAVAAFEEFNSRAGYAYKLVITSFFGEKTKTELLMRSDHILFTGNVLEEELAWLYSNADLILFPSEYEGLGMPALEAVEFSKPVLCSSIDVFKEITEEGFFYCDPYSTDDISRQLQSLLINNVPKVNEAEYGRILDTYTWKNTAKLTVDVFRASPIRIVEPLKKIKLAIFSPNPSGYSAIGKVVQEQHHEISKWADVDYYLESGITQKALESNVRVNYLPYIADCKSVWAFDKQAREKYDKIIYHIGNSEYHIATIIKALAYPGDVILHDGRLTEIFSLIRDRGYISKARFSQEAALQEAICNDKNIQSERRKSSYIATLVNTSLRVIVHSKYTKEAVLEVMLESADKAKVKQLNLATPTPLVVYDASKREEFTIGYAGVIHPAKGLDLIKKLTSKKFSVPVVIKLFGFSLLSDEVRDQLLSFANVRIILKPTDARFIHELESCNVILGYRPDYHGETSLSTLEAMRLGLPVIVNEVGWFKELPEALVYKVTDTKSILSCISNMIVSPESRILVDERLAYINKMHNIEGYVNGLLEVKE